ncbi:hypothetical protein [Thalassobaculum litoreum]|uniref:Uncharacterized protein n=1 Tax=Thalassobaculum litoreum DSM 18839 TaxID=1123362 RepID=A0A8G2EYG3_9PROT|nr:hypothetical protein [Thalassobaculum litoreum]SDG55335.1 hypothetical protein SAMN05660686_04816 [Thalassobaculum litoreum DSM 18839]
MVIDDDLALEATTTWCVAFGLLMAELVRGGALAPERAEWVLERMTGFTDALDRQGDPDRSVLQHHVAIGFHRLATERASEIFRDALVPPSHDPGPPSGR